MIKILVVDDYEDHRTTLSKLLTEWGNFVRTSESGFEALKITREWEPHLIIYDGLLDDCPAWRFCYNLLQNPPLYRPYLVALTGAGSTLQRRLCEETGFDEYHTKPIEQSVLADWTTKARARAERG